MGGDMARRYEMKRRAERVEETRRRITEAAVDLHGSVGPARTTISAVAERAGVDRLTVYRHFPDEAALFAACSTHWLQAHPVPDPATWASVEDPEARLRCALTDVYGWYRSNEAMMENFFRDGPLVAALAGRLDEWQTYLDDARAVLVQGWPLPARRRRLLAALIGHALDFHAWASLTRQGLDTTTAVSVMTALVVAQAGADAPARRQAASAERARC
jgi:AcrR family transcriptional regulator